MGGRGANSGQKSYLSSLNSGNRAVSIKRLPVDGVTKYNNDGTPNKARTIEEWEEANYNKKREYALIVDASGNAVDQFEGVSGNVGIVRPRGYSDYSLTVTHNHPSGGTFSPDDVETFLSDKFAEVRARGGDNLYVMRHTTRSDSRAFGKAVSKAKAEIVKRLDNRMDLIERAGGQVDINVKRRELLEIADDYWRVNAARYGYEYTHTKRRQT